MTRSAFESLAERLPGMSFRRPLDPSLPFYAAVCGSQTATFPFRVHALIEGQVRLTDLVVAEDLPRLMEALAEAEKSSESYDVSYRLRGPMDERLWVREQGRVTTGDSGPCAEGYLTTAESPASCGGGARQELNLLKRILNSAPVVLNALDRDGRFLFSAGSALAGLDPPVPEWTGLSIFEINSERPELVATLRRALAGESLSGLMEFRGRSFESHYAPLRDGSGELQGSVAVTTDVTAREEARRELMASEERFRQLAENASELIAIMDGASRFLYVSPAYTEVLGYAPEELLGRSNESLLHEDELASLRQNFKTISHQAVSRAATFRFRHKQGHWVWLEGSANHYTTSKGETRIVAVNRSLSELREARHALDRQLHLEAKIAELARHFLGLDADQIERGMRESTSLMAEVAGADRLEVVLFNPARREVDGHFRWSRPGTTPVDPVIPSQGGVAFRWMMAQLLSGKTVHFPRAEDLPAEAEAERASAQERGVKSILTIPVISGTAFLGYLDFECCEQERTWGEREITLLQLIAEIFASGARRKYAEQNLARQLEFEMSIAGVSQRLLMLGPDRIDAEIESGLADAAELAGADRCYLLAFGRRLDATEDYQWHAENITPQTEYSALPWATPKLMAGEVVSVPRVWRLPPDAAAERAELSGRGVVSFLAVPVQSGDKLAGVIAFESMQGQRRWSEQEITLLRLAGELLVAAVRRKRSELELRESQSQLVQAQKMEAVGRLAGGIAHDFNNLLTVVAGNARSLVRRLPEGELAHEEATDIQEAADRATLLTRQLLSFSRRPVVEAKVVDLNQVTRDVQRMLSRLLGEDIELRVECAADRLGMVRGDANQLEQVVVNLAVNARDAMDSGDQLTLSTANIHLDEEAAKRLGAPAGGKYVVLEVTDTGTGMTREVLEHAFDPFFTTKDPGRGTGLGLSMVYSIAHRSGGTVSIHSTPAEGTRVCVYLPRLRDEVPSAKQIDRKAPVGGTETLLVVEDEPSVRRLMLQILRSAGYTVVEASNGTEALQLVSQRTDSIDLLISDIVMPGMRGGALAERLQRELPQLKVLFVTGYPEDASGASDLPGLFLQKPFSDDALLHTVRELLDAEGAVLGPFARTAAYPESVKK